MHQSLLLLCCPVVYSINDRQMAKYHVPIYDPTSKKCADIMNYLLALPIYVFFSIIPILMLILYPFNVFVKMQIKPLGSQWVCGEIS